MTKFKLSKLDPKIPMMAEGGEVYPVSDLLEWFGEERTTAALGGKDPDRDVEDPTVELEFYSHPDGATSVLLYETFVRPGRETRKALLVEATNLGFARGALGIFS